jgi:hypothetical protein
MQATAWEAAPFRNARSDDGGDARPRVKSGSLRKQVSDVVAIDAYHPPPAEGSQDARELVLVQLPAVLRIDGAEQGLARFRLRGLAPGKVCDRRLDAVAGLRFLGSRFDSTPM